MNTVKIFIENHNQLLGRKGGGVTVHSAVQTSQHTVAEKKFEIHNRIHACKPIKMTMVSLTNLFYALTHLSFHWTKALRISPSFST